MKLRVIFFIVIIILFMTGMRGKCLAQADSDFKAVDLTSIKSDSLTAVQSKIKTKDYINSEISEMPGFSGMITKGIFSLLIVVVLIFGFVYILRRFVYNRGGTNLSNGLIKIINTTFIAPKKSIHLIKIMDRILVVGITENHMQTLAEFSGGEIPESIIENRKSNSSAKQFSSYLNVLLDKVTRKDLQEK